MIKKRPVSKEYSCKNCGLYKNCLTKRMQPYGNFKKGIINIGEAPGETEDRVGMPFQGRTGKLLQRTYRRLGIDLFEDCLNINSVACRPEDNEVPSNFQMDCCRKRILQVIEQYKPKVIILLGNSAVYSLIGNRWKRDLGGVTKWRGFTIPDQDFKTWVCPTFHPSYVERSTDGAEETVWMNDLRQAFSLVETYEYQNSPYPSHPFPVYKKPQISIITDLTRLDKVKEVLAIDFETTGLKPHATGQRIVSCAIAIDENNAFSFMLPKTRNEIYPLVRLLEDPLIAKMGQNIKFETAWAEVRLKAKIQNWVWDTMLATHVYDNRQGITSLKFQTYVQLGIIDYSSEIEPWLKAVDNKNANSLNRILELVSTEEGKNKLLTYGGYDAINTYRLAMKQRDELLPF
jgi:uracil-DNA glycosylase family 4